MAPSLSEIPVILLVFNRPELTKRVFDQIRRSRPADLFVVADGPRKNRPEDIENCREVREFIEQTVSWNCRLTYHASNINLGCAKSVSSGLTAAFEIFDRAIVLEDDCVPNSMFFDFCAELLDRYSHDDRIAQIAGFTFLRSGPQNSDSYYFSRYPHCWGWATWRRAWRNYDHSMKAWEDPKMQDAILSSLDTSHERNYWKHAFGSTFSGRIDSWAYRWTLSCWLNNQLSAVASQPLVENIGFGKNATHTRTAWPVTQRTDSTIPYPLVHPEAVHRDVASDKAVAEIAFRRSGFLIRCARRVNRLLG